MRSKFNPIELLSVFFFVSFFLALGIGWGANIYQLAQFENFNFLAVLKAIGVIFPPLGIILGWLGIFA